MSKSKNDTAWELLFEKYNILESVKSRGAFIIKSQTINEVRESRLMAKFDHTQNLPDIFRKNYLSILPISRYSYVIGQFNAYTTVNYQESAEILQFEFPENIESIDYLDLYSESSALLSAYVSGIISDLAGEETKLTITGRMTTGNFSFSIQNSYLSQRPKHIEVSNSQCEIDAGFESDSKLLLIEAKNYKIDDFVTRQLYYPYRLWRDKVSKEVIPILLTYSNDIFNFFVYKFYDDFNYSSIKLVEQRNYMFKPEAINLIEITELAESIAPVQESSEVPFPQADNFERVIDLLGLLYQNCMSSEEVAQNYDFNIRQSSYYISALKYLGVIEKVKNREGRDIVYSLNSLGKKIMEKKFKGKYLALAECILRHVPFKRVFYKYIEIFQPPTKEMVCEILSQCEIPGLNVNATTLKRRSQTVSSWVNWIIGLSNI